LYAGNHEAAREIVQEFIQHRVAAQIQPDGSMPEEMARTRPLFYSIYNLHAMFLVAQLAEQVDVDIWKADENNARLKAGLDYLAPYTDPTKKWPHPTIGEADRMEMFTILKMADLKYPGQNYLEMIDKLPLEKRKMERGNLALPLMR